VKVESLDDLVRATFELTPEALAEAEFEVDDAALVDIYAGLFTNPEFLLERYSHDQLDAGFAAMINCDNDLAVSELVWNRGVPIEKREHLISSMEHLYERFFRRESFVYSTFMWWDALAYAFECGNAVRGRSDEETRLQDAMFMVLVRILMSDAAACIAAAIHGLGHLHHPQGEMALNEFIERTPGISDELREYARQAALGLIQ